MYRRELGLAFLALSIFVCIGTIADGQVVEPQTPIKPAPRAYVPVTVSVNLNAATEQIVKEMQLVQNLPPLLPGNRPIFKRPLFKMLRDQKPLRKLLVVLIEKIKLIPELEKLAQPLPVGEDRWLNLNFTEIVYSGVKLDRVGANQVAFIHLAVRMQPEVVLSNKKPAIPPLPQISMGQPLLPPPGSGTPIDIALKIDPKSLPKVLPPDATKELDKYGIDPTEVRFSNKPGDDGQLLVFDVPIKKPLVANLQISFVPELKNNVLTFTDAACGVSTKPSKEGKGNSVQDALQQFTQNTIKAFVLNKMKKTTVDFAPHLKQITEVPLGPPGIENKVHAAFENLRVESVEAERNLLVFHISGVVSKGGIVILTP